MIFILIQLKLSTMATLGTEESVNFHKCVGIKFASSTVTIDFKLANIKLESSDAYLPKLEKNLSQGFEIIDILKKMRFKHMPTSRTFLYL